jgi:2-polyprenyl-3-methyl-5-hydroxy-6-metoxy-1,4-benzoquinol methylase
VNAPARVAGLAERPVRIGPAEYASWHASRLGRITDEIEQALVLRLAGQLEGRHVLDMGCGDGMLALSSAFRISGGETQSLHESI